MNILWQQAYAAGTITLPQASSIAAKTDSLHDFLFWMSVVFLVIVTTGMVWFVVRYHKSRKGRQTAYILENHKLETLWTVGPLILMLFIFAWGYIDYLGLRKNLPNPIEINVVGKQWMWNIEYTNGRKTLNELYLPNGKNIKLIMTSEDVLHSFYMPNFRLKQDVVPGIFTTIQFQPTMLGTHPIYCAEFCGTAHSDMLGKIIVLEPADFEHWLNTGKIPAGAPGVAMAAEPEKGAAAAGSTGPMKSPAEKGKDLYQAKGCFACHSTDGTPKVGPSHLNIFGRVEELQDGSKITVDENYIRQSLMEPQAKVVKGFPPSMPTFKGLLTDDEVNYLIAYLKSLKGDVK